VLKELDPSIVRLSVLWNPMNAAFQNLQLAEAQSAARASGIELTLLEASMPDDLERVFASMREGGTRALLILADPFFALRRDRLGQLAAQDRLLTACGSRDFSEAGCLISYGPSYFEASRRAASYVHKILRGARPSDLPVEQPTTFHLIINANTAKALGYRSRPRSSPALMRSLNEAAGVLGHPYWLLLRRSRTCRGPSRAAGRNLDGLFPRRSGSSKLGADVRRSTS
jgi:ABC-type uncharacterized transport system substrate-binding protein